MISKLLNSELEAAIKHRKTSGVLVFSRTENSDLLPVAKPSEAEFFERLFAPTGTFWTLYKELGLGAIPDSDYLAIIAGRMYFCDNVAEKFIYSVGMRKDYAFENGVLVRKRRISPDNLLLLLSAPVDTLKHATSTITIAFKVNEALKSFVDFSDNAKKEFNSFGANKGDSSAIAEDSLKKALVCMQYSFLSSLAYALKIKLADSRAFSECDLEELVNLVRDGEIEKAKEKFGFYSEMPYAISYPRFSEDATGLDSFAKIQVPKNPYIRWRENCKFLAARYLAMRRSAYLRAGKEHNLNDLIFFLKTDTISSASCGDLPIQDLKDLFSEYKKIELPSRFVFVDGNIVKELNTGDIIGESVAEQSVVSGKAVVINSRSDFSKNVDGKIIVSDSLMPDLVELYDRVIGIVSSSGGGLAHSAVIAREMNLPCIVQTKNMGNVSDGDLIELDGKSGKIKIIEKGRKG